MDTKLTNAPDTIKDFHRLHPTAPRPTKKMQLQYSAEKPDPECSCPIGQNIPEIPSTGLFAKPEFLSFRQCYQKYSNSKFKIPEFKDVFA
jgi:hypothetical protein